eukprot:13661467-Heterocapsa_arctica.AAC.1
METNAADRSLAVTATAPPPGLGVSAHKCKRYPAAHYLSMPRNALTSAGPSDPRRHTQHLWHCHQDLYPASSGSCED